ncbi:MAG: prephenate dehydrogenase [Candidatus Izemoplasmatales bacterium]
MKIGIIGLGLIGGTIAKALNKKHSIIAYDIDKNSLEYAKKEAIIEDYYLDIDTFLKQNSIIYLCLYPHQIIDFFKVNKNKITPNQLFIEISGIKKVLIEQVNSLNIPNLNIVYSHPIAGREKSGVFYSDDQIFKGANYAIIDQQKNNSEDLDTAFILAKDMGFKNISLVTAEEHDEVIAYTSQLTHIISMSLVNSFDKNINLTHFTGDSYRDLTRIADINISLWTDLFTQNKEYLIKQISSFQKQLEYFKEYLEDDDIENLQNIMKNAFIKHQNYLKDR